MNGQVPERVQLRRTAGWRKPDGAIVVARPTRWGNPYHASDYPAHAQGCDGDWFPVSAAARNRFAVVDFRALVEHGVGDRGGYPTIDEIRETLGGRDLCCWCPLTIGNTDDRMPCHADILLKVANPHIRFEWWPNLTL